MELLFVVLLGAILGLAARYTLPHRHTHGVWLLPAVGVITASILWVALTWAGLKWNAGVIWWITVLGTAAVVVLTDILVGRVRSRFDDRLLVTLSKGAAQPLR